MNSPLVVAAWAFALTNVDTLAVLVAFCADDDYRLREVLAGHFIGFAVGLAAALAVVFAAAEYLQGWVFLLGIVPLALGVWGLVQNRPDVGPDEPVVASSPAGRIEVVTTASIGLAGENLAVYIPLFSTFSPEELAATVLLYVLAAAIWFLLAVAFARRLRTVGPPAWLDRWFVPTTLILVGAYVLLAGWLAA